MNHRNDAASSDSPDGAPMGFQERVLRTFTVLQTLREDWSGALILGCGLGAQGAALAVASNIAGAVCLSIDESPELSKAALRAGACDFLVNSLDEALRTIKNELRKRLPLSVGLQGDCAALLGELYARGVSPEVCANLSGHPIYDDAVLRFAAPAVKSSTFEAPQFEPPQVDSSQVEARQAEPPRCVILRFDNAPGREGTINTINLLTAFTRARHWQLGTFAFNTSAALRAFDARALSVLSADDRLRRRWLQAAARILRREHPIHRNLWLTEEESRILESEFSPPTWTIL